VQQALSWKWQMKTLLNLTILSLAILSLTELRAADDIVTAAAAFQLPSRKP